MTLKRPCVGHELVQTREIPQKWRSIFTSRRDYGGKLAIA